MKYCSQCGHANDDDALFCEKDGCRLDNPVEDIQSKDTKTQVCEKCGFENGMDMKFCGRCGFRLNNPIKNIQSQVCKKCGFKNEKDMKFCGKCGTSLLKKKQIWGSSVRIIFMLLFFIIVGLFVFRDKWSFIIDPAPYYLDLVPDSSWVSSGGGTKRIEIDTNMWWLTKDDFYVKVSGGIADFTFVDDRTFEVHIARSEDVHGNLYIELQLSEKGLINFRKHFGIDDFSDREYFYYK